MAQHTLEVSLIESGTVAQLEAALLQLLSEDNSVRGPAEQQIHEWEATRPGHLIAGLANILSCHASPDIRSLSAILLRRISLKSPENITQDDPTTVWVAAGDDIRSYCQGKLLQVLLLEAVPNVRHKVCDTISELARETNAKLGPWPELLAAIFECVKSSNLAHREASLRIVASLPSLIANPEVIGIPAVVSVLSESLASHNAEVKVSAMHASVSYMLEMLIPDEVTAETPAPVRNVLLELMPPMLNAAASLTQSEEKLVEALGFLTDLAEEDARMFRNQLPSLVDFLTKIMKSLEFEPTTRQSALELLLTMAESRAKMVRKYPQFTNTLVPILLQWMSSIEDSRSWHETDDLSKDDDDNDEEYIIAEQAMDRLALSLGGKTILPVSFGLIPKMLGSENWSERHAGLMAISVIGEGSKDLMSDSLEDIVKLVLPYLRDAHPRVRYAACNTIGQMCTDFAPAMQNRFCEAMLTNLIPVMDDMANPRVQAHCAAALVNLAEDVRKEQIAPFLDHMFTKLVGLLNSKQTYVQEQAITTIATIADSAGDYFIKYYGQIMPMLLNLLQHATDKRFRLLRGKALECASLIALAVGKETFSAHASEFLAILVAMQQTEREADDPVTSYLLVAWARVCKVIGADFVPYLDIVMPPLLQSAHLRPDVALIDADESTDDYPEEEGWEFVAVDGQKFGIKTNVLEDKHTAVEMLACYARDLRAHFIPWVEKVMELAVKLLKFYFHEGVRHAAAGIIPLLFTCMKDANIPNETIANFWAPVSEQVLELMVSDMDPSFSASMFSSFAEVIECLGSELISPKQLETFVTAITAQMNRFGQRMNERLATRKDADHDEEEEVALQEDEENDEELLLEAARAAHETFKATGTNFLPYFETLLPTLQTLTSSTSSIARHFAICVFGDLIHYASPESWRYQAYYLEGLGKGLVDNSADIRQASAYAIGLAAQKGGPSFYPVCAESIKYLSQVIGAPESRADENVLATENAISAVGKICHFAGTSGLFDVSAVLSMWIQALPILNDEEEADHSYRYLLTLLESNNAGILGESNANVPKIINVLTDVLASDMELADELMANILSTLQLILASVPEELKTSLWNNMALEKRAILKSKLGI